MRELYASAPSPFLPDRSGLQRYIRPGNFCHSYDMADILAAFGAGDAVTKLLTDAVLWHATTAGGIGGLDMERFCGLGAFVPAREDDLRYRGYDTLAWYEYVYANL